MCSKKDLNPKNSFSARRVTYGGALKPPSGRAAELVRAKADAAEQVLEARIIAHGIKEGMYLEELENV